MHGGKSIWPLVLGDAGRSAALTGASPAGAAPNALGLRAAGRRAAGLRASVWTNATMALCLLALVAVAFGLLTDQRVSVTPRAAVAARPVRLPRDGLLALPRSARASVSAVLGASSRAYDVQAHGRGLRAFSPAEQLGLSFDSAGLAVSSGPTRAALELRSIAYGADARRLAPVTPSVRGNRVQYAYPGLRQWFSNGPLGVEQGFTVARPAPRNLGKTLTLSIALAGNARASLAADGQSVVLAHAHGATLRYGDLRASDSHGRRLPGMLRVQHGRIVLQLDTHGASYPLRVDPLIQQGEKLRGGGESGNSQFGYSVALSSDGNTAIVGSYADAGEQGAAWVFTRSGTTWTQQGPKLAVEKTGQFGSRFGWSVALSADGNTALIGGPHDNRVGAAWVFTRSGASWTQQGAKLTAPGEPSGPQFGWAVSLSADGATALISGPNPYGFGTGAAWVFTRSGETWTQQGGALTGSGENSNSYFGTSIALSGQGDTALIGGPGQSSEVGAAWVFTRSGETWTQQGERLTGGGEVGPYVQFGDSVALSFDGNTGLVGGESDNHNVGAAWAFTRTGASWSQQGAKLTGAGESGGGGFGRSVSLSSDGNTALVGAYYDKEGVGAAWLYARTGETWSQGEKLNQLGETGNGMFGWKVALSGDAATALIGGIADNGNLGAAWVFAAEKPKPPTVVTGAASAVTQTSAALNATVAPNKLWVSDCHFEYGTSEAYEASVPCASSPGSGEGPVAVSASAGGLSANTSYHFRIVATSPGGTSYGEDSSFKTLPNPPAVVTTAASSVGATAASLDATVDPQGGEVSDCHFEYGPSAAYGASAPCATAPGSGASPVEVAAAVEGLSESSTYHFRIVASNAGGTSYGADQTLATLGPPGLGRCVKVAKGSGRFENAGCTKAGGTKAYEWSAGVAHRGFTTTLKTGVVTLETVAKAKVTCTSESGTGEYRQAREVANVTITLHGCESIGRPCTSAGAVSGELITKSLEGTLGWQSLAERKVALDLYPVGRTGPWMEYHCTGAVPVTLQGSVLASVSSGRMHTAAPVKYKATRGVQLPQGFEGQEPDVLIASLNGEVSERLGVSALLLLTSEQAVEINAVA